MTPRTPESLLEQGRRAYGEGLRKYARQLFRKALKDCGPDGDAGLRADIHIALGKVERDLKSDEAALSHYRSGAEIYRQTHDQIKLAHASTARGESHVLKGHDFSRAVRAQKECGL